MLSLKNIIIFILIFLFSYIILINIVDLIPSKIIENLSEDINITINDIPAITNLQTQITELRNAQKQTNDKFNSLKQSMNDFEANVTHQLNTQTLQGISNPPQKK